MLEEVQKPGRRAFEGRLDAKELRQLVDHDDDCDPAEEASHHWSRQKIANPPHLPMPTISKRTPTMSVVTSASPTYCSVPATTLR